MSARDTVLGNIRAALGRDAPLSESERQRLRRRDAEHARSTQPQVDDDLIAAMKAGMQRVQMGCEEIADVAAAPAAVLAFAERHQLPASAVIAPALAALDWPAALAVRSGAAGRDDQLGVSACLCAVAETGSIVLASAADSPTTLNFLPENHIVVLRRSQVLRHLEDVWPLLRELGLPPRAVNLNTGPSRTADIEQTIEIGAHGPRRMHVLLAAE